MSKQSVDYLVSATIHRLAQIVSNPTLLASAMATAAEFPAAETPQAGKRVYRKLTPEKAAYIKYFLREMPGLYHEDIGSLVDTNGGRVSEVKLKRRFASVRARQPSPEMLAAARIRWLRRTGKPVQ